MKTKKYLVSIIFFIIFLVFLLDVIVFGFFFGIDRWISSELASLRNPFLTSVMMFFTAIGNYFPMILLFLALLGLLLAMKRKREAFLLSVCMAVGYAISELLKIAVHRARPESILLQGSGYSFPSQHAAISAIFFLVLIYSFKEDIRNKILKNIFVFACVFMFLAIGFSRIYLGVHWTGDVIAGFSLGIALVNFIRLRYMQHLLSYL